MAELVTIKEAIEALQALVDVQPYESPIWENVRWEAAVEQAKEVLAGQLTDWQPIETAPKDGTRVDVWCVGYGSEPQRFTDAWFQDGFWWYSEQTPGGLEVYDLDRNDYGCQPAHVTHWKPIDEPPA